MAPGAVFGGTAIETVGASVSGTAPIVIVASALPLLPAASRPTAFTLIVDPGAATGGIETVRAYGGVAIGVPGALSTVMVTDSTLTLSTASATTVTSVPG